MSEANIPRSGAYIIASNITSPLGMTTAENYLAVKSGRSALQRYDSLPSVGHGVGHGNRHDDPSLGQVPVPMTQSEPYCASLFTEEQRLTLAIDGLTCFESLVVRSVSEALSQCPKFDITAGNVIFILSTTKANVEVSPSTSPGAAAERIARRLGFTTMPVVVCNACISGVAAIILAQRLLQSGQYDYAVVCGADVQSRFTISGFQSLKAVSADECRPFDMERTGLNLGEAAATVIMMREELGVRSEELGVKGEELGVRSEELGVVEAGVIRNDAYHISSPSKNGEGAWLALASLTSHLSPLTSHPFSFINAHGTATMFNDQMESVAIERAGLADIPVNGLKGYYGHTLGAAGVLETVVSLAALRDHTILATRGFAERGVSGRINVTTENIVDSTSERCDAFIKMISGFGGGNAAIVVSHHQPPGPHQPPGLHQPPGPHQPPPEGEAFTAFSPLPSGEGKGVGLSHRVILTPTSATIDGQPVPFNPSPSTLHPLSLTDLYKHCVGDYPKFYKMDGLSRLGFLASELLLQAEKQSLEASPTMQSLEAVSRAVVLFNSSSSIAADRKYIETIAPDNYFPSPSVFVYTLPNIVTGEIAMRNGYHGETSFFILPKRDDRLMSQIALSTFQDREVKSVITGWIDYYDETHYEADLWLLKS